VAGHDRCWGHKGTIRCWVWSTRAIKLTSVVSNQTTVSLRRCLYSSATDTFWAKGAVEQGLQNEGGNTRMQGQLGHRDDNAELKNADSDLAG
jgi:hypothetical protein